MASWCENSSRAITRKEEKGRTEKGDISNAVGKGTFLRSSFYTNL
jgi:hypothetical protein